MATATEPGVDAPADAAAAAPPKKKSKLPLIIAGVGFVVGVQTVLTIMLMPKAAATKPAEAGLQRPGRGRGVLRRRPVAIGARRHGRRRGHGRRGSSTRRRGSTTSR